MNRDGNGAPEDDDEAAHRTRRAAEQGSADAQNRLGDMYCYGWGVPEDDDEAVKWYRRAAEQGHATAQYNLGGMYHMAGVFPKNYAEAVRWYRRAAEQGNADAQNRLGVMYDLGAGEDYAEAVNGIDAPPSRQCPRSVSEPCTTMARASRKTTPRR